MGTKRVIYAGLAFTASIILYFFAAMMRLPLTTFQIMSIKMKFDLGKAGTACSRAATAYLILAALFAVGPPVWAMFAATRCGYGVTQAWASLWRSVAPSIGYRPVLTRKVSDLSDESEMVMRGSPGGATGSPVSPLRVHRRNRSGEGE